MLLNKLSDKKLLPHMALITSVILWAASGPIIKLTLAYIPVSIFLFFRFLIVCTLLLPYLYFELKKTYLTKVDILNLIIIGLLSQSSLYILFISFNNTGALDVTIIGVFASVASIWLGNYFYHEKINKKLTIGLIVSIIGTFIVAIEPVLAGNLNNLNVAQKLYGNFMALIYNVFFVSFLVYSKIVVGKKNNNTSKTKSLHKIINHKKNLNPNLITAVSFYIGLATITPIAIYEYASNKFYFNLQTINPNSILGILYMAIFASIIGYMCFQYGLKNAKISDTAIYGYLSPVLTIPFAYLLINEVPTLLKIIGGIIIMIGVIIAEAKKS